MILARALLVLLLVVSGTVVSTDSSGQTMPPGHPPTGGTARPPAPSPGSGTGGQALTWTVPAGK